MEKNMETIIIRYDRVISPLFERTEVGREPCWRGCMCGETSLGGFVEGLGLTSNKEFLAKGSVRKNLE